MAKSHWHGALHTAHKLYTRPCVLRGDGKRELVAALWTSSRRFSRIVVESSHPGAAEYICNQGPLSSAWAHCISCAPSAYCHCRRGCCCPLQCGMETRLNSTGGPGPYRRSWSLSFLHLLSVLSPLLLLSKSRSSWHDNKVIGIEDLAGDPRAELMWQGFKHHHEEQWAEYWALVNTDLHFKLFTVPLTNTDTALHIGIHPLHQSHSPLLHTKFSQRPPDELPRQSNAYSRSTKM